jgi:tape measure domain-containing protein
VAGNNVRIGALRYDIIADSSLFTQGVTKASRMSRKLAKDIAVTRTPMERYRKEIFQLNRARKAGLIDERAYMHAKKRIKAQLREETALLQKNTRQTLLNTKAKKANARAGLNFANIGGAAASMFGGRGGAAVGRGIGIGAMAGGPVGVGLAAAFGGSFALGRMMEEFGDLQEAATDLKVFLGEEFGEESANAFRKIARESSLTTEGLIKNARVWASYGLETENIVDMVERLGIAAGGEREAFDNLTRAMAQVNAAGKLMGQEKNQLINAGFSLKIIADEAGVAMTDFSKAMEEGLITAEHVNNALIKATSEGGLYFGRLEKKAQTLNGQMDLLANNFNDLFANLGESQAGLISSVLNKLNSTISSASAVISEANELERMRQKKKEFEEFGRPDVAARNASGITGLAMRDPSFFDRELNTAGGGSFQFMGSGPIGEFLAGARTFSQIFETEAQVAAQRAEEKRRLQAELDKAEAEAVKRGMLRPSDYTAAEDADKRRAKAEQEALNYLEERSKLQKELASDEERHMIEMQEEFDEYAAKIRGTVGSAIDERMLLQMKKDAMAAESQRAIDKDQAEDQWPASILEKALDVAGPGQMRQNSIEEFIYLKTQRDNARKEKREEDRYQKDRQLKIDQHKETIRNIQDLKPTQQQTDANQVIPVN